jgi:CHASE3 domain sensor protein
LEEAKGSLHKELEDIEKEKNDLKKELKYEKTTNTILIIFVLLLLIVAGIIWFVKI